MAAVQSTAEFSKRVAHTRLLDPDAGVKSEEVAADFVCWEGRLRSRVRQQLGWKLPERIWFEELVPRRTK